jgi:protein-S-isoprenylcysteine O-methyltransferase Ste14
MDQEMKENLGYLVNGISIAVIIYLGSVLDISLRWPFINIIGWILFGLGILFVVVSTYTLIRNRGKGLIDWGIYSIVRHPMYLGAIMLFLSWVFLIPHWITLLLSIVNIYIVYIFILQGDQRNIELFGSEYTQYIGNVPRLNFVAGILKLIMKKAR